MKRSLRSITGKFLSLFTAFFVTVMSCLPVTAAPLSEARETDKAAEYVPGEAIVIVREESFERAVGSISPGEAEVTGVFGDSLLSDCSVRELMDDIGSDEAGGSDVTGGIEKGESSEGKSILLVHSDTLDTEELIAKLQEEENVLVAEPNYILSLAEKGSEEGGIMPSYAGAGHEKDPDLTYDQYMADSEIGINIPGWNNPLNKNAVTDSGEKAIVAVVDSGVMYDHPDLDDVMWDEGEDYPELKKLGGGRYGYNAAAATGYVDGSASDPYDRLGHGTSCAGVIAAEWNNEGVSGVANGARIMAVACFNPDGWGSTSAMIAALNYVDTAIDAGVKIGTVNCSWSNTYTGYGFAEAIRKVASHDTVICFASGNHASDMEHVLFLQTEFADLPNVIFANATEENGDPVFFTNYGAETTDVFVPGHNVLTTTNYTYPISGCSEGYAITDFDTINDFGPFTVSGCRAEVVPGGREGNCLKISGRFSDSDDLIPTVTFSGVIPSDPDKAGETNWLCARVKVEEDGWDHTLTARIGDGDPVDLKPRAVFPGWRPAMSKIGARKADKYTLTLEIPRDEAGKNKSFTIYIDDLMLADRNSGLYYDHCSGTSFSAPIVVGESAVLRARYPGEGADKIAARIIGSVRRKDRFTDMCVSGGMADLTLALEGKTAPVLQRAKQDGNSITIEGYFFGSEKGTLTMDGGELAVTEWTDSCIKATLPGNVSTGKKLFEVVRHTGYEKLRDGHQRFMVTAPGATAPAGTFTYLKPEGLNAVAYELMVDMISLGDKLYIASHVDDEGYYRGYYLHEYDPATGEMKLISTNVKGKQPDMVPRIVSNLCVHKDRITFLCEKDGEMFMVSVDPQNGVASTTKVSGFPEYPGFPVGFILGEVKGELLVMGGMSSEVTRTYCKPYDVIYRYDDSGKVDPAGNLASPRGAGRIISWKGEDYVVGGRISVVTEDDYDLSTPNEGVEKLIKKEDGTYTSVSLSGSILGDDVKKGYGDLLRVMEPAVCGDGLMVTGPVMDDENGNILCDTWIVGFDDKGITPAPVDKIFSANICENVCAAVCDGRYYVIANTSSGEKNILFGYIEVQDPVDYNRVTVGDYTISYKSRVPYKGAGIKYDDLDLSITDRDGSMYYLPGSVKYKKNKNAGEARFIIKKLGWEAKKTPFAVKKADKSIRKILAKESFDFTIEKRKLCAQNTTVVKNRAGNIKKLKYLRIDAKGKTKALTVPRKDYEVKEGFIEIRDTSKNYRGRIPLTTE